MNDNKSQNKNKKTAQKTAAAVLNSLEKLNNKAAKIIKPAEDLIRAPISQLNKDLIQKTPQTIKEQIFGKMSGELKPGESVDINAQQKEKSKQPQIDRSLLNEEKARVQQRTNELRMQIKALMDEVKALADSTADLGNELKIAAMQAPVDPGVYHVQFLEKLISFIKSFRKKIESASVWLHTANQRAQKKNYWSMYKKHGAKFLLSGEHYLTRSAG